ncbi:hypothetical protein [Streptomyces sp. A-14]|uniref:hypothetical protein n=1 Tax=Streptomyces sp. A-14 TaxID=3127467 RepID=UPI003EC04CD8
MTGPEHYRKAEQRLLMAWEEDRAPEDVRHLVAEAQVHATLALAAATALTPGVNSPSRGAWVSAVHDLA